MQTASRKIGEFLVNRKVLSKDDLEYALRKEADSGVPLAKILSAEALVSERDLVAAVADQLNIPFWDPTTTPVSPLVEGMIPAELAIKHMVVGVGVDGDLSWWLRTTRSTTGPWPCSARRRAGKRGRAWPPGPILPSLSRPPTARSPTRPGRQRRR